MDQLNLDEINVHAIDIAIIVLYLVGLPSSFST
jgi:hypothetical protein